MTRTTQYAFVTGCVAHTAIMSTILLDRVLEMERYVQYRVTTLWTDCGPHFHSYGLLAWAMLAEPRKVPAAVWTLSWYCEPHEKGCIDGFFGLVGAWLMFATTTKIEVLDLSGLVAVLRNGAAKAERSDPPPNGRAYRIIQWTPLAAKPRTTLRFARPPDDTLLAEPKRPYIESQKTPLRFVGGGQLNIHIYIYVSILLCFLKEAIELQSNVIVWPLFANRLG